VDPVWVGILGIALMVFLMVAGIPIAFAMAVVGILGTGVVAGWTQTLSQIGLIAWGKGTDFVFVCIPLFIFMGQLTSSTGIATQLYEFLERWLGRLPGGLAVASVCACGLFGAITGSSLACVATMGTITYPQMKKYGYDPQLATGVLSASGTLGILIPPSIIFAFYGILTDTSIGALFIAGIIPGIITIFVFSGIVLLRCILNPELGPVGPRHSWKEKLFSLKSVLPVGVIFLIVVGTMYGGVCSPTEASGIGAAGVILVSLIMGKLTWPNFRQALWDTGVTSSFIFAIMIGGFLIARFLVITNISQLLVDSVSRMDLNHYVFILLLIILYTILGCILDLFGSLILTLPFVFPITLKLGIDPVWFGVFVTVMMEVALITPPVGLNVFVMSGIAKDVPMEKIFRGIIPFLVGEFVVILLLIFFPWTALWLPSRMQ
jgi:tripartite ATP-independent transporter DctM subunit